MAGVNRVTAYKLVLPPDYAVCYTVVEFLRVTPFFSMFYYFSPSLTRHDDPEICNGTFKSHIKEIRFFLRKIEFYRNVTDQLLEHEKRVFQNVI